MATSLVDECTYAAQEGGAMLLHCISKRYAVLERHRAADVANTTEWLLLLCGALIFIMQVGFAMLCAGAVRKKNLQNTMLKNLLDAIGSSLAFSVCGYALSYGGDSVPGPHKTFVGGTSSDFFMTNSKHFAHFFVQFCFAATCNTIVAGTLAERCRMSAYFWYSLFLAGFVYPVIAHAVWSTHGVLSAFAEAPFRGAWVVDFAGSGAVHLTGGVTALLATWVLGARTGRFHDDAGELLKEPKVFPGHSMAFQVLGTLVLWFGCTFFESLFLHSVLFRLLCFWRSSQPRWIAV
jgi:ammonium transporter, Amt family